MAYFWPLILVVASNSVYHICAKSLPESVDPLASLTVTYLIGSIFSGILYFVTNRGGANLLHEYSQMNWAPYLLGLAVVGLEAGSMHAYRAGRSARFRCRLRRPSRRFWCSLGILSTTRPSQSTSSWALRCALSGCFSSTNELCRGFCRGMMGKTCFKEGILIYESCTRLSDPDRHRQGHALARERPPLGVRLRRRPRAGRERV